MNLETKDQGVDRSTRRWQDEVTEDGIIAGGEEWQKKYTTERNGRSS
jgi:hypothetical protein